METMEEENLILEQESPLIESNKENSQKSPLTKLLEKLKKLNKKRKMLEKKKKYIEAGKITNKIKSLGKIYKTEFLQNLKKHQKLEKQNLEKDFKSEFSRLLTLWQQKLTENEKEIKEIVDEIHEKQKRELEQYERELRESLQIEKKKTSEILNLEFKIEKLAKNQEYEAAAILQKKADFLEEKSARKKNEDFEKKIRNLLEFLIKKHDNELSAYDLKLGAERNKIMKLKERDFEVVEGKFKVLRGKLEEQQRMEVNRESKLLRNFKPNSDLI